jgi:hypothetical protein
MLVNKDNAGDHYVSIQFSNTVSGAVRPWRGPADFFRFSADNYVWHPDGVKGHPSPDLPPASARVGDAVFLLPKGSLDVVRGTGSVAH